VNLWIAAVVALTAVFAVILAREIVAGLRHRRHCKRLAAERGAGSKDAFRARMQPTANLTAPQIDVIYAFLSAHAWPGFDIMPHDSLQREFGVGGRFGLSLSDFLDDLRAQLNLPRRRAARPPELRTVGELIAFLDREAEDSGRGRLPKRGL